MPVTKTDTTSASLTHAVLELLEPGKTPGVPGGPIGSIEFQMNPKELTMAKSASWKTEKQKKASSAPPATYQGPEAQKLSVEMFFDDTQGSGGDSVVQRVEKLFQACAPTKDSKRSDTPSAPWVRFKWGVLSGFVGYIKSVSAKYTLFSPTGTPLRAVCAVALEEIAEEPGKQNPTSGGLRPRRVHTLKEGDTLAGIAYREYGSAAMWRVLADVNGIDDPMRLVPGRPVFLPAADELVRPATLVVVRKEVANAGR
ncbi:LysM peptidoglycan-binding domain-containing protein [Agromyces aureus]|uniref:Peptidase M23 n=1 Tax=Agromyces aureus TaxID=453304 RepID=A0A191WBZ6_9MICO|nr:LysM peptidoglycan-binding domain-containing protein [Agromyces aureus]ANJ25709.1 peptidase M23 [Agromyces aureus]